VTYPISIDQLGDFICIVLPRVPFNIAAYGLIGKNCRSYGY